ncbi:MAG TPA: glycerol-3-phosphate dehydrogenase [Rhodoblastus sp.]|nr:glycerol-3-phosphate dehydrogenase [Rhodoblastus sp.]
MQVGHAISDLAGMTAPVDVFVIGGGINGCGVARDAVGRGYSVVLAEMDDLASGTSSRATKLIHGGLRYLEYYEFRLVREALGEREIVWRNAPHIVHPLRFVLPYATGLRPAWMLRAGLFIYDHLGGRQKLPPTRTVDLAAGVAGQPLKPLFSKGFEYSDCWVDDARLVVLNARDAADRGAIVRTRRPVVAATSADGVWRVRMRDARTGQESEATARLLVNAAGPWVDRVLQGPLAHKAPHHVRLVQGSHIVVPRLYEHDRCYIFQNADGRIVFAIPYEDQFTLIGTTDRDYKGDPAKVEITDEEIAYLCAAANEYFRHQIAPSDVVWAYSGVRPLYDDHASAAQEATRDYVLHDETIEDAPLISIFGGKITTYRRLAEAVLDKIGDRLGARGAPWTANAPLPGGEFEGGDLAAFTRDLMSRKPFLPAPLAQRLARSYGTRALDLLGEARALDDLGRDFGAGLTAAEIDYLAAREWAETAEDILWRRTKLGLHGAADQTPQIEAYLATRQTPATTRMS